MKHEDQLEWLNKRINEAVPLPADALPEFGNGRRPISDECCDASELLQKIHVVRKNLEQKIKGNNLSNRDRKLKELRLAVLAALQELEVVNRFGEKKARKKIVLCGQGNRVVVAYDSSK